MHIVLYQPEIPQNTGNIVRLCAVANCELHLIKPLGFIWDDKRLIHAGLDYWELTNVELHVNFEDYLNKYPEQRLFFASTKAHQTHSAPKYDINDSFVFGPESRGLPPEILSMNPQNNIRIPMREETRSLNLSNSVSIILYEALRQLEYPKLR